MGTFDSAGAESSSVRIRLADADPAAGVIGSDWFGVIQTGFNAFAGFERQYDVLDARALRWPGGTLSETSTDVYSLDNPDIFDARYLYQYDAHRSRPTLTDSLAFCVERGASFSMIVPTARYADDLSQGIQDLRQFMHRLLAGDFGELPRNFTLEIGNEYAALVQFKDDPAAYGRIADAFIQVISDALADEAVNVLGADISIAIQMGKDASDDAAIRDQISTSSLQAIDSLVVHTLPISLANFQKISVGADPEDEGLNRVERVASYVAAWQEKIARAGNAQEPDLYLSAWTVGGSSMTADGLDLNYFDYGLRGASTVLDMFAGFSAMGVDAAAAWGVDVHNLNSFSKLDEDGEIVLSHTGTMFNLLATNLAGTALIGGYADQDRTDRFMTYTFGGEGKVVMYVAANDISDAGESIEIVLDDAAGFSIASATSIGMTYAPGSHLRGLPSDRLLEIPLVRELSLSAAGNRFVLDFSQDYQIIQIVLDLAGGDPLQGGAGNDRISGLPGDDLILGGLGHDVLHGNAGDDTIRGGYGHDTLHGDAGNDRIIGGFGRDLVFLGSGNDVFLDNGQVGEPGSDTVYGGEGDDTLNGGGGSDRLFGNQHRDRLFGGLGDDRLEGGIGDDTLTGGGGADQFVLRRGGGSDVVTDFSVSLDHLQLDRALWAGTRTATQVVADHAEVIGGSVVFTFADGTQITLQGLTTTAGLDGALSFL